LYLVTTEFQTFDADFSLYVKKIDCGIVVIVLGGREDKSKQTKGRGVGKFCSPPKVMARLVELIDAFYLVFMLALQ
jgi:hypothetical protein